MRNTITCFDQNMHTFCAHVIIIIMIMIIIIMIMIIIMMVCC